jgi:hypothetical protein
MNKLLITLILLVFYAFGYSQKNLEYVETLQLDMVGTTSVNNIISTLNIFVEYGQTWKVESVLLSRETTNGALRDYQISADLKLIFDDNLFYVNNSSHKFEFPYWIGGGNHVFEMLYSNTWNSTFTGHATISVLVFNIVEE